ncbi:MAG: urate hydroxylase PuuD [Alkalilacustris sp.]
MLDWTILGAWLEFVVRWVHVITAIAWIGSSFYFIALDLGLRRPADLPPGATGEEWQVHGGGFYHIQKYAVAPDRLPDHLTWFKWEAYATWLSGFALLILVYYVGAEMFLIDLDVADLPVWGAVALSLASLGLGWLIYDALCRSRLGHSTGGLMLVLFGVLVAMSWAYAQVFSGRAALLHLGAFTATIMSANVFLIIIPNQKVVVADLRAGRVPAAEYGRVAKQRSLHNNYLTLPVLFLMLSNHAPLAFATEFAWIIGALVFLMGVTIRHFFNTMHAGRGRPWWTWAATSAILAAIIWLSALPGRPAGDPFAAALPDDRFAAAPGFDEVHGIVLGRCSMCHAADPLWPGLAWPPGDVRLESPADVAQHARAIYLQAGRSRAMPPGNLAFITDAERAAIRDWYRAAQGG